MKSYSSETLEFVQQFQDVWGFTAKKHGMRGKLRLVAKLLSAPGVDEGGVQKEMNWIKSNNGHLTHLNSSHPDFLSELMQEFFQLLVEQLYNEAAPGFDLLDYILCLSTSISRTLVCLKGSMRNWAENQYSYNHQIHILDVIFRIRYISIDPYKAIHIP